MRNAGCRIPIPARINDLDEFLDRIVEANDSICERAVCNLSIISKAYVKFLLTLKITLLSDLLQGILLDLLQKARRMEEVVVPQQILDAESTAASEQTLFERQGRYTALLRRLPAYKDKPFSSSITTAVPLLVNLPSEIVTHDMDLDDHFK